MNIKVQVFAGLADAMGSRSLELELPGDACTVSDLKRCIIAQFPSLSAVVNQSFAAVNQTYAQDDTFIRETDEIALIPPVSGGQEPELKPELYTLTYSRISAEEVAGKVKHPNHGAALIFDGTTRELTNGQRTMLLEYDAYEPMALKTMQQIGQEIAAKWPGTLCAITHRLGTVGIGETSVVIAVSSPHRAECYDASRYAIERLKQIVPIWKKERWEDGSEWKGHQLGPWDPTKQVPQK
jgi:molybdopterin synthase catalytic subunit